MGMMGVVDRDAIDASLRIVHSKRMNTKWFRDRLRGIELSQRGLPKLLDCAVSWCSPVLWIKP